MNFVSKACVTIAIGLAVSSSAIAQSAEKKAGSNLVAENELKVAIQSYVRSGYSIERSKKQLLAVFSNTDVNGGGVTEDDYKLKRQMAEASSRAYGMLKWLQKDLDGNGEVTREEVRVFNKAKANRPVYHQGIRLDLTEEQVAQILKKLVDKSMVDDANKDGKVDFSEAAAAAKKKKSYNRTRSRYNKLRYTRKVPLSLDADNDGAVSKKEYETVLMRILKQADENNDGIFSHDEASKYSQSVYALRRTMKL
ncbi:MAG: hypothetical protein ACRBBN_16060 [Methyloligellaceae bacterium]